MTAWPAAGSIDRGLMLIYALRKYAIVSSLNKAPRSFQLAGYFYAKMNEIEDNSDDEDFASPQFPLYSPEALGETRRVARVARARAQPIQPPLYKKKSMDQKQIRFHQCYFNPISCFRK